MMPDRVEAPMLMFRGQESKSSSSCFGEFIGMISDDAESLVAMAAGQGTFVSCLATSELYGRDVYAHTAVLKECSLVPGDIICFKVHVNKKGWPQLTAPVWKMLSPEKAVSPWTKCDRLKPGCAQKIPGMDKDQPMLPMSQGMLAGQKGMGKLQDKLEAKKRELAAAQARLGKGGYGAAPNMLDVFQGQSGMQ